VREAYRDTVMIEPSPTSKIAADLARGTLHSVVAESATKPGYIVLRVPNTSYEMHLVPTESVVATPGQRITGRIRAKARRVDVVGTGGRYVEPVYGRPRRVQGTIVGVDVAANTITVNAGVPIICEVTDARQQASAFTEDSFVSFDVLDGATFTPVSV
jgi:hypothetical protein